MINFVPNKRIKVKFFVPDFLDVRLGNIKAFLREHTNKVVVEELVESCYLSEVPSQKFGRNPGKYFIRTQYNKASREASTKDYY